MRFGLVGTGPWARKAHGAGLLACDEAELIGVWGRRAEPRDVLATDLGVASFATFEALLDSVDAVAFAVPPDVQAGFALRAAEAGKHVLLDKPLAFSPAAAAAVADAVEAAGVASVVFLTDRFSPAVRSWHDEVVATGGWQGGAMTWLSDVSGLFAESAWRAERGALWDIGPHALAALSSVLGPVASIAAVRGERGAVVLTLTHGSGATSTAELSLTARPDEVRRETTFWGEAGSVTMPGRGAGTEAAVHAVAARELVESARTGVAHPLDAALAARQVELLSAAAADAGLG